MSVRTILLAAAACAVAVPAFAATSKHPMKMHHTMAMHTSMHTPMMHHGHMMGHTMGHMMTHGSTASADNSADKLNAQSLEKAHGTMMPAPAMATPAPAGGGT
jgi:hypothetical protein